MSETKPYGHLETLQVHHSNHLCYHGNYYYSYTDLDYLTTVVIFFGDGSECRDFVVRCGVIQPLLVCITPTVTVSKYDIAP